MSSSDELPPSAPRPFCGGLRTGLYRSAGLRLNGAWASRAFLPLVLWVSYAALAGSWPAPWLLPEGILGSLLRPP
jgi:hypothetical protein